MALYQAGWAHSVEVWDGEELIGGVFGTGMGTIFSAESTFHRRPGAGKVAIADLGLRLARTRPEAPIDVQVPSDYLLDQPRCRPAVANGVPGRRGRRGPAPGAGDGCLCQAFGLTDEGGDD
ncbi:hypothetical protein [Catenulispora sp. EB89]|uniref:hypothetical protein n=1 Tax=Catenulispora sp. EB89 TaxID=3156257 RepID=UPI0035155DF7